MKRPRQHNEAHLKFVRQLPCCICGDNTTTEAAHVRSGNLDYGKRAAGLGEKPSDAWTIPLCGAHHRDQHKVREMNFWTNYGKDPFALCSKLWIVTGDHEMAEAIISRQLRSQS